MFFLQSAIPKLGFKSFKHHLERNISIKGGKRINIFTAEMIIDDVAYSSPCQSNGTFPA